MGSIVSELSRSEIVLEVAESRGIHSIVASPWVSTLPGSMELSEATDLCREQNEALAAIVHAHPRRIAALGAVPLQNPERSAQMLAEVLASGLSGVEVTPCVNGHWLGEPAFETFFAVAAELGAVIFIHPATHGLGLSAFDDYYLWNSAANPVETGIVGAQLIMAGVLERHPSLSVVLAHGGGVLPAIAGRLDRAFAVRSETHRNLARHPYDSLRRLHFDTVTHDLHQLSALVAQVGASRVLLGSDHPFDMGSDDPVSEVRALSLDHREETLILQDNALALFPTLED